MRPPVVEEPKAMPKPLPPNRIEPKEKITSNTKVLQDGTGSSWSDISTGTSLATTTATIASIQKSESRSKIQHELNLRMAGRKSKIELTPTPLSDLPALEGDMEKVSLVASLRSRNNSRAPSRAHSPSRPRLNSDDDSEPDLDDDTIAKESHVTDLLNQAVMMDTILDDIQEVARKRPKGLLLGK